MKTSLRLDDLRATKRAMLMIGQLARQDMHPLEVAGVLISWYRDADLEIERRALSYALVMLFMASKP